MNHRNPPPPLPILRRTTATQILKETTSLFYSHFLTFLFLSSLFLCSRYNVHSASHYLSSLIDRDPSLKSFLSRVDHSNVSGLQHYHDHRHRRHRVFQHFPRAVTLDNDFLSGDSDFQRSLFHRSSRKPLSNGTLAFLSNDSVVVNGVSFPSIVKIGDVRFMPEFRKSFTFSEDEEIKNVESSSDYANAVVDSNFLIKGFELERRDTTSLLFLARVSSAAYVCVAFAVVLTYAWANGIIFLKVIDHLLGNYRSFIHTVWDGSRIAHKSLLWFIVTKWTARDALAQLIGIFFFGGIENRYVFLKVFLRMKLMPFANLTPWITGHEWESAGFIVMWFLSDFMVGLIFAVDSWVVIAGSRRRQGKEIVKEGCRLLVASLCPALQIRCLEVIICGSIGRWMLRRMFGEVLTMVFQSLMEVYFIVAWLVYYLAARHKHDTSLGRTFGRRELGRFLVVPR